ncbi:thiol-disulfide oxidoreductase DCC family protein [Arenimonas oryziterrae]|uniref:Thiol-disulfide oxidoreductase n=1 Tax=Arenimonas oryziterrae DSM 21050 = YC6267 TaxID=1121015 RepID=A0A091AU13_9GAMM|nr:DUF393 domain-containing protein [Arenimonas oryziterrae]KFN42836.1 hypothetical protein N789_11945 [Arenimonas oryziterrae DSM 21050 = YC6267]
MTPVVHYPLTIYYDAHCPLCVKELGAIKDYDRHDRLRLVDCSGAEFDDPFARRAGIGAEQMMRSIHARDEAGQWFTGVDVFVLAYRQAGIESMARLWSHPWLRPLWDRLYPWVARHRMFLSRLGFTEAFDRLVRWAARRSERQAAACRDGRCELP